VTDNTDVAESPQVNRADPPRSPAAAVDVSVLIPVLNGMPYFREQLAALTRQTYRGRWEVIVSDNGSTDGSIEAARAIAGRVRLTVADASQSPGRAGALSAAAEVSTGRFLLFCDADDIVADDWVERMAAGLERFPSVAGYADEVSLNREDVRQWRQSATPGGLTRPFGWLPSPLGANCGLRREVWDEVGGFDPAIRTGEEHDLFWRVQLAGHELAYLPDAVVAYRHRPDLRSMMRQWRAYGVDDPCVVGRYRSLGLLPAGSWRNAFGALGWLCLHAVNVFRGPDLRGSYLRTLAILAGQVEGSVKNRVLHVTLRPLISPDRDLQEVIAEARGKAALMRSVTPGGR